MKTTNNDFCKKVLVTEEQIDSITTRISEEITKDYLGKEVVFVAILNGAFMFAADLVKKVNVDCYIDFMQCSTYGDSTVSSGNFIVKKDLTMNIKGKDIIIVEDILDSGYTLKNLCEYLKDKNPKSIKIATFIDKPMRRTQDITSDYCGMVMDDDAFIVGYGLDYAQKYRNLPYIAVLKEEIYNK